MHLWVQSLTVAVHYNVSKLQIENYNKFQGLQCVYIIYVMMKFMQKMFNLPSSVSAKYPQFLLEHYMV